MMLDTDRMARIVKELYGPLVDAEHGSAGGQALREVLQALPRLYRYIAPEACQREVLVFRALHGSDPLPNFPAPTQITSADLLQIDPAESFTIQVLDNGQFAQWSGIPVDPDQLSATAVVYCYHNRTEHFVANGVRKEVVNPCPAYPSAFALPTFSDLRDALARYGRDIVKLSSCAILSDAWFDECRLFFKSQPEGSIRRSLYQFLRTLLRDAEVRQEQNVNETRPVDIKVTWMATNRLALIEVKWLGDSRDDVDGHISVRYRRARANEGARQLTEYLDANMAQVPGHMTRGYLVVVDGRRRGLSENSTAVTKEDGLHYRDRDIIFHPAYHELRDDFEVPVRMFAEPICAIS